MSDDPVILKAEDLLDEHGFSDVSLPFGRTVEGAEYFEADLLGAMIDAYLVPGLPRGVRVVRTVNSGLNTFRVPARHAASLKGIEVVVPDPGKFARAFSKGREAPSRVLYDAFDDRYEVTVVDGRGRTLREYTVGNAADPGWEHADERHREAGPKAIGREAMLERARWFAFEVEEEVFGHRPTLNEKSRTCFRRAPEAAMQAMDSELAGEGRTLLDLDRIAGDVGERFGVAKCDVMENFRLSRGLLYSIGTVEQEEGRDDAPSP